MAHNLNYNDKTDKYAFFSTKEKAWHGLGTIVQDYPTSMEALQFAQLDYKVEKRPLFTYDTENNNPDAELQIPEVQIPNFFATVRTDTDQVLGVVGKDYKIVQNVDAFSFFDSIVGGDGILYETAGAIGDAGQRIFITAKLPEYIKVGKDDLIEKYLFLTTSHDGYESITAAFTPIRVVCANTLGAALRNCSNKIKIRHTACAEERLKEAHKVMGISNLLSTQLEDIFNQWAKVRITDSEVKKLIQLAMVPNKEVLHKLQTGNLDELSSCFNNICNAAHEYALTSPTQQTETTRGTLFGVYNAITGYFNNVRSYKNDEAKFKSIMFGTGQIRTQTAFDLCTEFMKHGDMMLN